LNDIFTSKADVLAYISGKLNHSIIQKLYDFTVSDWRKNNEKILYLIEEKFNSSIIIRSSAFGEDSLESSKAGAFSSILNISPNSRKHVSDAIESVIMSYEKNGNVNDQNKILIQKQATDIVTSGVIFTKSEIGAPYYIINYEEGSSTEGVTQGKINNLIKIIRDVDISKLDIFWSMLIKSVQEIEALLNNSSLDIEFGINDSNEIIIFQVRPLALIKENFDSELDKKILKFIPELKSNFKKINLPSPIRGSHTILSDMSDWNPAEIIGNHSNLLDYSLYDYLIMDKIWHEGRSIIGYQNIEPYPLMVRFGKKSYVDIRGSFNSLIPDIIDNSLKVKLIEFYLKKLKKFPHLHDKIEFEIVFSCYDLSFEKKIHELREYGFTNKECNNLKKSLIIFSNNLIHEFPSIVKKSQTSVNILKEKHKQIIQNLNQSKKSYIDYLDAVKFLLNDCIQFGTLPFSTMARIAFVGSVMMTSLVDMGFVKQTAVNSFMQTINTPLSTLREDFVKFTNGQLNQKDFFSKYGHLRPGTYDITALRYDKHNNFSSNLKFITKPPKSNKTLDDDLIKSIFKQSGIHFDEINFSQFVSQSLKYREELKFNFTKNLSDALEFLTQVGIQLGFSKEDLSNLDISHILDSYSEIPKNELITKWNNMIISEKSLSSIQENIILPSLIFKNDDFEIIQYFDTKPNFITEKSLTGEIVNLSINPRESITGKIVCIENADPGYDWIFTENPLGLITKYGGVASHMAIRCAEINLPAAIGIGDKLFEKINDAKKVLFDCKNKKIIILEKSNFDEEIEIEKTLKSIGYIK